MSRFQPIQPTNVPGQELGFTAPTLRTNGVDRQARGLDPAQAISGLAKAMESFTAGKEEKERRKVKLTLEDQKKLDESAVSHLLDAQQTYIYDLEKLNKSKADRDSEEVTKANQTSLDTSRQVLLDLADSTGENTGLSNSVRGRGLNVFSTVSSEHSERLDNENAILEKREQRDIINDFTLRLDAASAAMMRPEVLSGMNAFLQIEEADGRDEYKSLQEYIYGNMEEVFKSEGLTDQQVDDIFQNEGVQKLISGRSLEYYGDIQRLRAAEAKLVAKERDKEIKTEASDSISDNFTNLQSYNRDSLFQSMDSAVEQGYMTSSEVNTAVKGELTSLLHRVQDGTLLINPAALDQYESLTLRVAGSKPILEALTRESVAVARGLNMELAEQIEDQWIAEKLSSTGDTVFTTKEFSTVDKVLWDMYSESPAKRTVGIKSRNGSDILPKGVREDYSIKKESDDFDQASLEGTVTEETLTSLVKNSARLGIQVLEVMGNDNDVWLANAAADAKDILSVSAADFISTRARALVNPAYTQMVIDAAGDKGLLVRTLLNLKPNLDDMNDTPGLHITRAETYVANASAQASTSSIKEALGYNVDESLPPTIRRAVTIHLATHRTNIDRAMTQKEVDSWVKEFKDRSYRNILNGETEFVEATAPHTPVFAPDALKGLRDISNRTYSGPTRNDRKVPDLGLLDQPLSVEGRMVNTYWEDTWMETSDQRPAYSFMDRNTPQELLAIPYSTKPTLNTKRHDYRREASGEVTYLDRKSGHNYQALKLTDVLLSDDRARTSIEKSLSTEIDLQKLGTTKSNILVNEVAFQLFDSLIHEATMEIGNNGGEFLYSIGVPLKTKEYGDIIDFRITLSEETYNLLTTQ